MNHSLKLNVDWYIKLNMHRWYSDTLVGWIRFERKSDILMTVMFKVSRGIKIKALELVGSIGFPDRIFGKINNGVLFYKLRRNPTVSSNYLYMCVSVMNNQICSCGTNTICGFGVEFPRLFFNRNQQIPANKSIRRNRLRRPGDR